MDSDPQGQAGGTLFSSRRNRQRSAGPPLWGLGLLILIAVGAVAGWLWFRSRQAPEPLPPTPAHTDSLPSAAEAGDEPFVLPPLGASDVAVRQLLLRLSDHPRLAAWLVTDDLIRRFVEAAVDVSRGSSPVPALEMLIPAEPFSVQRTDGRLLMHPRSQRRYDVLGEVFASVDTERATGCTISSFRSSRKPTGSWAFRTAPSRRSWVAPSRICWRSMSPPGPSRSGRRWTATCLPIRRIESLTPAQKHLYRLGPENARRVQEKLREISDELGLRVGAPGGR
jgi:hypothetical protein